MAETPVLTPVPEAVGQLYDRATEMALSDGTFGENLHFGYWDGAENLSEAAIRLTDVMVDRLRVDPRSHVLDVGCGVGGPALRIARNTGAAVTGVNISAEQVAAATRLAGEAGLAELVDFRHGDAMDLPFPDDSFDAAIAIESIIHVPDRHRVLAEIARTLRPGGRLVLTDFFERSPIPAEQRQAVNRFLRDFMMTTADADDYPSLLRRSGLRFEEVVDISEHTIRQTFTALATPVKRDEQVELFGHDLPDQFNPADMVDVTGFGCLLVVARKP